MSLNETSTLIAESRKIVEAAHSDTLEPTVLLNMILQIVTNIDKRIEIMETTMIKKRRRPKEGHTLGIRESKKVRESIN